MPRIVQRRLGRALRLGGLAAIAPLAHAAAQDLPNAAIAFRFHNRTPSSIVITQVTSAGVDVSNMLCVPKPDGHSVDCGFAAFQTDGPSDPETLRMPDDAVVLYWATRAAAQSYCPSVQVFWSSWSGGRGGATTPANVCHASDAPPVEITAP